MKLTLPKKISKRLPKKEKVTPVFVENSPIYKPPQDNINSISQKIEEVKRTENQNPPEIR